MDPPDIASLTLSPSPALPPLSRAHVDRCALPSWLGRFRAHTFKSRVVGPLPQAFVDYLHADGVYLPLDRNGDPQPSNANADDDSGSEDTRSEATEDDDAWLANIPNFPDLERQIEQAIEELGGAVFPKLNWTAPRDASWVALNNSLKCSTPADVFLLLKSSDFVSHDLGNPYVAFRDSDDNRIVPRTVVPDDPPEQLYLILRKWIEIEPSLEFRCFVRERRLVGISQRDTFNYYPFLPAMKEEVQPAIESLWQDVVLPNFDETNFTFDVYLSRRSAGLKALVVDFNPFAYYTDALLFDWDELAGWQTDAPMEFRIIESDEHARACSRGWANPKFSSSRLPLDASIPPDSREIAEAADILS